MTSFNFSYPSCAWQTQTAIHITIHKNRGYCYECESQVVFELVVSSANPMPWGYHKKFSNVNIFWKFASKYNLSSKSVVLHLGLLSLRQVTLSLFQDISLKRYS